MNKKQLKKIFSIFFAYTQNVAVSWYRMMCYAKYLKKRPDTEIYNYEYDVWDSKVFDWQNNLNKPEVLNLLDKVFTKSDITIMGALSNPHAVALIKAIQGKYHKKVFMEMDDYVMTLPSYNVASNSYKPGSTLEWLLVKQMEYSDGMIVSTPFLKEAYSKYNKNIHVVPNGVDLDMWKGYTRGSYPNNREKIRIGFSGSNNHTGDIRIIRDVIYAILDKYPNVEFYFLFCCPEFLRKDPRIIMDENFKPVDQYPSFVHSKSFDIALAPLRDNNFNRGKSNLRFLEMSMLKIPTVASKSLSYGSDISNGHNGYLCKDEKEWFDSLSTLIESRDKRWAMGDAAYKYVTDKYDVKKIANDYRKILVKEVKKHG